MNILRKNLCYIYTTLWMVYYLQGLLMIEGMIAQSILVILLLISFCTLFYVNIHYKTGSYVKWLNIMIMILSIYGLIPIVGGWSLTGNDKVDTSWMSHVYLQNIYMSILPIYVYYYLTIKKLITQTDIKYVFILLLAFSITMFYQNYFSLSVRFDREELTNNAGFFFVPLIPMLQLVKIKDFWKYMLLIVIFGYMLLSMKRGAILAGVIMVIMFIINHLRGTSWKQVFYVIGLSTIIFFVIYHFAIYLYSDSNYFQTRIEQTLSGDSSGRDTVYSNYLLYFWEKTTILEFIIGNGANATRVLLGNYAHNDWLEFAINQGVLGVLMYLFYWIVFIREWKNYKGDVACKRVLGHLIIAYFLIALYSMSFDCMPITTSLCIGYCLAEGTKRKQLIFYENTRLIYRLSR